MRKQKKCEKMSVPKKKKIDKKTDVPQKANFDSLNKKQKTSSKKDAEAD